MVTPYSSASAITPAARMPTSVRIRIPPKNIITPNTKIMTSTEPISPCKSVRPHGIAISRISRIVPFRSPMGSVLFSRYLAMTMIQASLTNSEGWMV